MDKYCHWFNCLIVKSKSASYLFSCRVKLLPNLLLLDNILVHDNGCTFLPLDMCKPKMTVLYMYCAADEAITAYSHPGVGGKWRRQLSQIGMVQHLK